MNQKTKVTLNNQKTYLLHQCSYEKKTVSVKITYNAVLRELTCFLAVSNVEAVQHKQNKVILVSSRYERKS